MLAQQDMKPGAQRGSQTLPTETHCALGQRPHTLLSALPTAGPGKVGTELWGLGCPPAPAPQVLMTCALQASRTQPSVPRPVPGPRVAGPRLPALEQVAPLQGVDGQVEPAWRVFRATCARQVSDCAGVGPSRSAPGLAALVGRKLDSSSLPGPSCCHGGLFQKAPGEGRHLVKEAA